MDGLIWVLALITGAAIGIGCAFLLTALILNASNNKGDSRSKVEEFSSDIVFFSQQDSMRMNPQEFVNFTEWNAEALCKSQEYGTRLATSLPFASTAPVSRYIPGKEVQEPQYAVIDGASGGAAYGAINGVNAVSREPVIFTSDVMSAGAFRKAVIIEFGKEIETSKYGTYRSLSGHDMTAMAYNNVSGGTVTPGVPAAQIRPVAGGATIGMPQYAAPQVAAPQYAAPQYAAPQYSAPQAGVPQYSAPQYAASQTPAQPQVQAPVPPPAPATPPAPEPGPIYEAPTATRPLWENPSSNDDFSDFSDMM